MEFDNKTIVIIGLITIGIISLFCNNHDLALAIGSGLVGYLSKDANITLNLINTEEDDEIDNI